MRIGFPITALLLILSAIWTAPTHAQSKIVLSRLVNVPDQYVGGDILKEIYARLGITVEFLDVEAARALALSSAGQSDGEVQRIAKVATDFPTLVRIEPPINYIEPAVFTTGLNLDIDGWESIRNYKIGIVRGVGSSENGTRGMPHVEAAKSLKNLIRMLDRGRFQLLVTDLFSGEIEILRMGLQDRIRPLAPPLERIYIYHYLHEKHRDLAAQVGAVIREMADSGELEALRQRTVQAHLEAAKQRRASN